jgi:PmbA protein
MARLAPEDPYAGLADPDRLALGPLPDLDLFDASEPTPDALEAKARTAEAAARGVPKVTNSDGASASWSASQWTMVTSGGFSGVHRASGFSLGASAIAGDENGMENGYEGRSVRWQADLPEPDHIGSEAGRRAAARLGARKIASTTAPVIFENRLAASLLGPMIGAISGPSIARGTSFLKDKLGQQLFAKGIVASAASVPRPSTMRGWPTGRARSSTTACSPPGCSTPPPPVSWASRPPATRLAGWPGRRG